jgi:biofilm PGA synthesis N-glycosyltransferase PgaC
VSKPRYVPVRTKLAIIMALATLWFALTLWLAQPWIDDLSAALTAPVAWFVIGGIALVPGYANAFLFFGLLFDRRPAFVPVAQMPPITVLIAAYNEEEIIADSLASFFRQHYAAALEILVIDDGSKDRTAEIVRGIIASTTLPGNQSLRLIQMPKNGGKARALNAGLAESKHDLIITVDADTLLFKDALTNLVVNQLQSPPNTAATAGTVLVRNSRVNLITRLQEWDYFVGIAVVKRIQSLLQGTMVAQGALSIYRKDALLEVGGWQDTVGEDIVLTWALSEAGYRVGYAENAFVFTNVPETYGDFYRQRKRWSRGLMEAFRRYPRVLTHLRLNTPFVYLNLAFPYLDFVYLFAFVPGVIAALVFGNYLIVGIMTLLLIPLAIVINTVMFFKQRAIFRQHGLRVRRNWMGLAVFTLCYQLFLTPATLTGYLAELLRWRKVW